MLQSSTRFTALHDALAHHPLTQRQGLSGFLIQPVQRLPRYVLLITDLLKNTAPEHADYADLTEALALMREVAMHINEEIARQENKAKVRVHSAPVCALRVAHAPVCRSVSPSKPASPPT